MTEGLVGPTDDPSLAVPDEDEEPDVRTDPVPIQPDDPAPSEPGEPAPSEPGTGEDDGSTAPTEAQP